VNFLVDAQLPPALAQWLREAGYVAQHVEDVGLREADDGEIWRHALQADVVIVTKDEDFVTRAIQTGTAPVIVWLRLGNASNRVLLAWLQPRWPGVLQLLEQGHRLVEVA
jgi:predicted nuclease of predicted toxin-antitoxin system